MLIFQGVIKTGDCYWVGGQPKLYHPLKFNSNKNTEKLKVQNLPTSVQRFTVSDCVRLCKAHISAWSRENDRSRHSLAFPTNITGYIVDEFWIISMYFRSRSPFSTFFVCQQLLLGGEEEQESRGKQTKSLQLLCCEQTKTNTATLVLSMNFSGVGRKTTQLAVYTYRLYTSYSPFLRLEGKNNPLPTWMSQEVSNCLVNGL